ncbi:MAG: tetratricopeptide repeat protein [Candidatus Omnitrophica bacterium]|nr:tetratricopeptide repeat protein [Candidatus Omnitrophota bacterium]
MFKIFLRSALGVMFAGSCVCATSQAFAQAKPLDSNAQVDADSLKKDIERLKNEKEYESKHVEEMRLEREKFIKEIRRVENLNSKYTKELDDMKAQMADQQGAFEARMKKMEDGLKESKEVEVKKAAQAPEEAAPAASIDVEKKANEILQKGGDLDPEDEKFKEELARAHYNMGNVYFERGEYQRAVVEFYQAVDLMPYDADAHYNLAFVSGEYIGDQDTALKHYQWYLYLKPNAADKKLVTEKIVGCKLSLRSRVGTRIDQTQVTGNLNVTR